MAVSRYHDHYERYKGRQAFIEPPVKTFKKQLRYGLESEKVVCHPMRKRRTGDEVAIQCNLKTASKTQCIQVAPPQRDLAVMAKLGEKKKVADVNIQCVMDAAPVQQVIVQKPAEIDTDRLIKIIMSLQVSECSVSATEYCKLRNHSIQENITNLASYTQPSTCGHSQT